MKWLFVFLVLFNLGAFGWGVLSRAPQGESWQLREFHPEKIRVLSPEDVAKLTAHGKPGALAARASVQQCLVWSGVTEADVGRARTLLAGLPGKPGFNELQGGGGANATGYTCRQPNRPARQKEPSRNWARRG